MIRPEEYEAAISGISMMCGIATQGTRRRQYTFVEISIMDRTDRDIEVSFYVPNGSNPKDASALVEILGRSPVNEAMDAWGEFKTDRMLPNHVVSVNFAPVPGDLSKDVAGCVEMATVRIPRGECTVNACWSHDVARNCIFVPTQNENISGWRLDIIAMQGNTHGHGKPPQHPLSRSFRHDLMAAQWNTGEVFDPMDRATLVRRWGPSLPYHNLWIPLFDTPENSRDYHSMCGAVLRDETSRRLMNFYDVMFVAVPAVCGSFIRNNLSYRMAHVPLHISERLTRDYPVIFRDARDGSCRVEIWIDNIPVYSIDPTNRERYESLCWVNLEQLPQN